MLTVPEGEFTWWRRHGSRQQIKKQTDQIFKSKKTKQGKQNGNRTRI